MPSSTFPVDLVSLLPVQFATLVAYKNGCLSSLLTARDVSPGGTSAPQQQKFCTDDVKLCPESGQMVRLVNIVVILF